MMEWIHAIQSNNNPDADVSWLLCASASFVLFAQLVHREPAPDNGEKNAKKKMSLRGKSASRLEIGPTSVQSRNRPPDAFLPSHPLACPISP